MSNIPELRDYQLKAKRDVYKLWREGMQNIMLQLPTGAGKSVVVSSITLDVVTRAKHALLLVHRKELVEQMHRHLFQHGIYAGVIMADRDPRPSAPAQVASVQTLVRRLDRIADRMKVNLIVTDEAHHATASTYVQICERFPDARHLGVTATPWRLSGQGFTDIYSQLVCGPTIKELIAAGHLVQPVIYASPIRFDLGSVKITAGDYNEGALWAKMNEEHTGPRLVGGLVQSYEKHAMGKKTCVFALNVEHSKQIADKYNKAGIRAACISGVSNEVRESLLRDFASGSLMVITNCDIVSEGFDMPAIECVQLARATKSVSKYLQAVGRALRPQPGKEHAIILDHGGVAFELGFPDDDRDWTLEGKKGANVRDAEFSEVRAKVISTGEIFAKNEIPEEIDDIELVRIDAATHRSELMHAQLSAVERTHKSRLGAWSRFCKVVGKPTREEIRAFCHEVGFNKGWCWHQEIHFGYTRKPDDYDEKQQQREQARRAAITS